MRLNKIHSLLAAAQLRCLDNDPDEEAEYLRDKEPWVLVRRLTIAEVFICTKPKSYTILRTKSHDRSAQLTRPQSRLIACESSAAYDCLTKA